MRTRGLLVTLGLAIATLLVELGPGAHADCPSAPAATTPASAAFARGLALTRVRPPALGEARREFARAIELDPSQAPAHYELAEVLLRLHEGPGYERAAAEHYTQAILLRPDSVHAYMALADLYRRLGFAPEARQVLHAALALKPPDKVRFAVLAHLAQVEEDRGELEASLRRFEEARAACGACTEPEEVVVYYDLGVAYAALQPPRAAEAMAYLTAFTKLVCWGPLASRYVEPCANTQETIERLQRRP